MDQIHRPRLPMNLTPVRPHSYPEPDWLSALRNAWNGSDAPTAPAAQLRERVRSVGSTPADRRLARGADQYGAMGPGDEFHDPMAMTGAVPTLPAGNPALSGVTVPTKPGSPPLVDLNAIQLPVGPQGEEFPVRISKPKSSAMEQPGGAPNAGGGALSAAGGHDEVSGKALVTKAAPPAPTQRPAVSNDADKMELFRFLMEAGLGTMAAGSQPGVNTLGAIGQGAMQAIGNRDTRKRTKAQMERAARSEAREEKRLGLEGRRVDLSADNQAAQRALDEKRLAETSRHNKATEAANIRKIVRDQMKDGVSRDQAILNLAQDLARSEKSSYVKDQFGLDTGNPSLDPQGYQSNIEKNLERLNGQFGTKVSLPKQTAKGSQQNPIEPTSQAEIDNAKPGTVFRINGQLFTK